MALNQNATVDRAAFPPALASRARRLGGDENIQTLIELAENKMLAGGGEVSFLISAGENGKSGGQECRMDCIELFTLANRALEFYQALIATGDTGNGPAVSCSYTDFSAVSGC